MKLSCMKVVGFTPKVTRRSFLDVTFESFCANNVTHRQTKNMQAVIRRHYLNERAALVMTNTRISAKTLSSSLGSLGTRSASQRAANH